MLLCNLNVHQILSKISANFILVSTFGSIPFVWHLKKCFISPTKPAIYLSCIHVSETSDLHWCEWPQWHAVQIFQVELTGLPHVAGCHQTSSSWKVRWWCFVDSNHWPDLLKNSTIISTSSAADTAAATVAQMVTTWRLLHKHTLTPLLQLLSKHLL